MRYFGKVFVQFKEEDKWSLAAIAWYKYLVARFLWGVIGSATSDKDFRHVPRSKVVYEKRG